MENGIQLDNIYISKDVLNSVLCSLPYLKTEINPEIKKNEPTMYQLLDGYNKINVNKLFKWRFKNKQMPNFLSENLVKKYGHKENLTYLYYLKQARPNMAAFTFYSQQNEISKEVSSKTIFQASLSAHIFALRHIREIEIVSCCIAFMEILGVNSENLRLHVKVATLVKNELDVSIENLLESSIYDNQLDLKKIMDLLEQIFNQKLNLNVIENSNNFIEALKFWSVIVQLAAAHKTTLPTLFLDFLAKNNSWLHFILVGDIFSYPLMQMMDSAEKFENLSVREHLLLALNNPKLLKQEFSESDKIFNNDKEEKPNLKQNSEKSVDLCEQDLWLVILNCHQNQDPSQALINASQKFKSPILSVLATYYKPISIPFHFFTWLIVSTDNEEIKNNYKECLQNQVWKASKILQLFYDLVLHGFVTVIYKGLYIFMNDHCMKSFFEFLSDCSIGDFENCQKHLMNFQYACLNYKYNKAIDWDSSNVSYLENLYWIETVLIKCIIATLGSTLKSTGTQIEFLEALFQSKFYEKFAVNTPDFGSLLNYTKILSSSKASIHYYAFDTTENDNSCEIEIERCINELILNEDYENALKLSKAANLKPSKIILAQYRSEFQNMSEEEKSLSPEFWKSCIKDFQKYEIGYEKAAEFFIEHAEKVKSYKDRYEILSFALEILRKNSNDQELCDTVEMAMWKSCILADPEKVEIGNSQDNVIFNKLKTEILSSITDLKVNCTLSEPDEKEKVEYLIGKLLDANKMITALRVSTIFSCKSRDLQVLMLCLSLAEGEFSPYQLSVQQRSLLSLKKDKLNGQSILRNKGIERFKSSSSLELSINSNSPSSSEAKDPAISDQQIDCLNLLTNLIESLDYGIDIGIKILLCYRLSVKTGRNYEILLTLNHPMQFFQDTIQSTNPRKFEIAKDIIAAYQIENQTLVNFLSEEIVAHITEVIEDGLKDPNTAWNYNLNLQSVIEFCKDSSLLGLKLFDMANKLLGKSCGEKRNLVTLKIIVELLIRSHDCFTTSCNMEGIASVLRKCQQLANSLQSLKHWSLLVRLVTGVGRYTEMNYIFQILKENDQFEFLLGKGLDKVPGLRMALLDFLKRYCPQDKELFNIVALHFRLYFEIAQMWKNEGKEIINELIKQAKKDSGSQSEIVFTRNENIEAKLQLVIENYTHATQIFLQDNKLNLASNCSYQAQLVALQMSLLLSTPQNQQFPCLFDLTIEEFNKAISQYLNYSQALILSRAYEYRVDWTNAIYNHCVINSEKKYLKDFISSRQLTNCIAIDCVKRFRLEKNVTRAMTDNIKNIINNLNDFECKYVLASQLGLKDIIHELLENTASGSFLKDTVWKKRYATEYLEESLSSQ